jgi:hypothetical protein
MRLWMAIPVAALLACAAPAFAQEAGQPGAAGEKGSSTGHNAPGTAGVTSSDINMTHHRHHHRHHHHKM